jgi:nucleotide-binding universal stress UspA family protein
MQRILIATDFSRDAFRAMQYGLVLAQQFKAGIELFTSFSPSSLKRSDPELAASGYSERARAGVRENLGNLANRLSGEGVTVSYELGSGTPVTAICERAEAVSADLVVLGAHGSHGFDHTFLGSTAERTARAAACPVLTTSADAPEASEICKILVATDFSPDAEAALIWAQRLSARCGAAISLIHSVVPPFGVGEEELYTEDKRTSEEIEKARGHLQAIAAGLDTEVEISVGTHYPETDALREAAQSGADLIVVGTRGRRGLPAVVLGSTTVQIMRGARIPVVSVKRTD